MNKHIPWHRRTLWFNWIPPVAVAIIAIGATFSLLSGGVNQADYSAVLTGVVCALFASCIIMLPLSVAHHGTSKDFMLLSDALSVVDASILVYDDKERLLIFNEVARQFYASRGAELKKGQTETEIFETSSKFLYPDPEQAQYWVDCVLDTRRTQRASGEPLVLQLIQSETERHDQILITERGNGQFVEMRTDVTLLKLQELALQEREKELEASRNEAQASNRAKSEFLANMSHEIRTPMNGVIGMTEVLQESDLSVEQRNCANTISKSALALLTLINDILDFSKIEAGKLELDPEPFDFRSSIEDVASLLATGAQQKGVEIAVSYSPELPTRFVGDSGRLRQIMTNLLGNAVKFTERGHVAIIVDGTVTEGIAELTVNVKDTGIGIPAEKLDSVFSVFEQVDGASNRRFEGTGLGLAITQRLAKLMGSEITAKSVEDIGSVFSFTLNLPIDASTDALDIDHSELDLTGKHVLIVDDLDVNCDILSRHALKWGMHPVVVNTGEQAIRFAMDRAKIKQQFDIAIFDFQMPGMDGHKLCEYFKAHEDLSGIPIVLLSSVDQSVHGPMLREMGFAGSLVKPVRNASLHRMICTVFAEESVELTQASTKEGGVAALTTAGVTTAIESHAPQYVATDAVSPETAEIMHNVLVVEDNPMNQMVVSGFMMKYNVNLTFADNGKLGVEGYQQSVPDLVLMDVSMPIMNGLEATSAIRDYEQSQGLARCPIVALTANAMQGDREMCLAAGMDDFMTKPVLSKIVHDTLHEWLVGIEITNQKAA